MIIKFNIGEEVFWGDDNKKVTIVNICPTIKGVVQSYEFYIDGTLVREIEYKLYKSDKVFENSKLIIAFLPIKLSVSKRSFLAS